MATEEGRARSARGAGQAAGLLRLASARRGAEPTAALADAGLDLIEGSPDGIAVVDRDGTVVAWNSAAARMFVLDGSQARGRELASLIFPEHLQPAVRAVLSRQLGEPDEAVAQRQLELAARRSDGRETPVDLTTARIRGTDGPLLAVYLRDASERSERERELHADARRRSAVLDLGQLALEGMSLDQLLAQSVALAAEELGVDSCEVWERDGEADALTLRASSAEVVDQPERIPLSATSQPGYTLLRGQGPVVVEDFRREGRFRPVEPEEGPQVQSAISVRIPGGEPGFGALVAHSRSLRRFELSDISLVESLSQLLGAAIQRSRVSDSLAEAESRLRSIVERLPSITYRASLGPQGTWEYVSPQVAEIFGITAEEWHRRPAVVGEADGPGRPRARPRDRASPARTTTARSTSSTGSGRGTAG